MGRMLSTRSLDSCSRRKYGKWRSISHSTLQEGRRENHHHQGKHSHQKNNFVRRDRSRLRCYTCDEIGHVAKNCPKNKNGSKKKRNSKRRHHDHTTEDDDPPRKRVRQEIEDSSSENEYVLISALMGNVAKGSKDWLIDSGASKHKVSRNPLRNYPKIIHPIRWILGMTTNIP